ncbi:MAG: NAD(P)(+) transhydrogenase (Re/Si-specific) subunit beta, partial [Acidimicrobiia bacterium]|nr:NAD(P)(+) transhydrogenase (Re/Si-specific) subunit beta [Acidimicrobiia bacterium]
MIELSYLAAAVLFIVGLKRLGHPKTARSGNGLAALGMLWAVVVTLIDLGTVSWGIVIVGVVIGAVVGAVLARRVQMTSMPELVAAFNGFGGSASAFVALAETLRADPSTLSVETGITTVFSVVVGSLTLSGSFIAYGKLQGLIAGRPIGFAGTNAINLLVALTTLGVGV